MWLLTRKEGGLKAGEGEAETGGKEGGEEGRKLLLQVVPKLAGWWVAMRWGGGRRRRDNGKGEEKEGERRGKWGRWAGWRGGWWLAGRQQGKLVEEGENDQAGEWEGKEKGEGPFLKIGG